MEDAEIVALYWKRDEDALAASADKYGPYCAVIARNILTDEGDAEECVNDTWLRAWNAIPPKRPNRLAGYFGGIVRNLALDRLRKSKTARAGGGIVTVCLDELAEVVGEEDGTDEIDLRDALNRFLGTLTPAARDIFMRRYWAFQSEGDIARARGITAGAVRMSLSRTRALLKRYLNGEETGK